MTLCEKHWDVFNLRRKGTNLNIENFYDRRMKCAYMAQTSRAVAT